jgi:hypothetical protein
MTADPARYVRRVLAVFGTGFLVLALYLAFIDPFGIYRHRGFPNAGLPALTWSRVAAAERLSGPCDVALVGSSRVVFGYGTKQPRVGRKRLCNGALGGTSMKEIGSVWDFIVDETDIPMVLLFLDLHMFHDGRGTNHDFQQSLFNPDRTWLSYHLWALTSFQGFEFSTKMLGIQLPIFRPMMPLRSSSMETRGMIKTTLMQPDMYRRFEGPDATMRVLGRILDEAKRKRVQVAVIIPAVHAMELETTWTAGLWELNKDWKRQLVAEMSARGVPLWDFATYHSPALSVLPTTVAEAPNPWWADMSHQSQLLGKLTMERIVDALDGKAEGWEPGFGAALKPDNIEAHLAAMDEGRERWRELHPDQVAWFEKVLGNITELDPSVWEDLEINRRRHAGEAVAPRAPLVAPDLGEDAEMEF